MRWACPGCLATALLPGAGGGGRQVGLEKLAAGPCPAALGRGTGCAQCRQGGEGAWVWLLLRVKGSPPQASHLPAGQDPVPGVLLQVPLGQQPVGGVGEGLQYLENSTEIPGPLARAPGFSRRSSGRRDSMNGGGALPLALGTNSVDSITYWPKFHIAPPDSGSRAALSLYPPARCHPLPPHATPLPPAFGPTSHTHILYHQRCPVLHVTQPKAALF